MVKAGLAQGRAPRAVLPPGWKQARSGKDQRHRSRLLAIVALASLIPLLARPGLALTPAGLVVTNVAEAEYDAGVAVSPPAAFVVAQVAGVSVDPVGLGGSAAAGEAIYYPALVVNTGNGEDSFTLEARSERGWSAVVLLDENGDGLHQPEETAAISQTPTLAPHEAVACLVAVTPPLVAAGMDTTTLTITSGFDPGCAVATSFVTEALARLAPDFSASPTRGAAPLAVAFQDLTAGGPISWRWDFGDGATSSEQHPTHVYTVPGTYSVTLTAGNATGSGSLTRSGLIIVAEPAAAFAYFVGCPTVGEPPLAVSFRDLSPGEPTAWRWDFGDGGSSTEQHPTHVYTRSGVYTVSLTVATATGTRREVKSHYITVNFTDVGPDHWAYDDVTGCTREGVILGYPDNSFRPGLAVQRDQIATYLSRAIAGGEQRVPVGPAEPSFADIPDSHWAYRYIEHVRALGVIEGYPDGRFHPAEVVDRAQMAVFLARSLADPVGEAGLAGFLPPATPTYEDVTPEGPWAWCHRHVEFITAHEVTLGYSDRLYHPEVACTRDQLAVYLARAFGFTS